MRFSKKIFIFSLIILTFFINLNGCESSEKYAILPVNMKIDENIIVDGAQLLLKMEKEELIDVSINFKVDREKVHKSLSERLGLPKKNEKGLWDQDGVDAVYGLTIADERNMKFFDGLISHPKTNAIYKGRSAIIASLKLPVGLYQVKLSFLSGGDLMVRIPSEIVIAPSHHGK